MAKKVVWAQSAIEDRLQIFQFWAGNNGSESFSEKLEELFEKASVLLSEFPELGMQTDLEMIRFKTVKAYKLFYRLTEDSIQILRVWDTRQNPERLDILHS